MQFEAVALMVLKAVWQADVAQKSQQDSLTKFFVNLTPVFLHYFCISVARTLEFHKLQIFFSLKMGMKIREN